MLTRFARACVLGCDHSLEEDTGASSPSEPTDESSTSTVKPSKGKGKAKARAKPAIAPDLAPRANHLLAHGHIDHLLGVGKRDYSDHDEQYGDTSAAGEMLGVTPRGLTLNASAQVHTPSTRWCRVISLKFGSPTGTVHGWQYPPHDFTT